MMRAAQLAAEAAMKEASARDANNNNNIAPVGYPMDLEASSSFKDVDQLGFLNALRAAEIGDQAALLQDINLMGLNPNDDSMQSLLQILAQQDRENARPDEHYLTIAQNGTLLIGWNLYLNPDPQLML